MKPVLLLILFLFHLILTSCQAGQTITSDSGDDADVSRDVPVVVDAPSWAGLLINEVAPKGDPADWFELFNSSQETIQLDKFRVSDDSRNYQEAVLFPDGLQIPAGDRLLLQFNEAWPGFGLGEDEELAILAPDGSVVDRTRWPSSAAVPGRTWGRLPDGVGPFAVLSCPSPGFKNREDVCALPLLSDIFFQKSAIVEVDITLPAESINALNLNGRVWVNSNVRLRVNDYDSGILDAGIRLKGRWGSAQTLEGKAAFKIKLDHSVTGQTVLGMEDLTLNNMVQDCTMLHEHLSYEIFRALDVPVPRTGWASVTVNGEPYGIYLLLEKYDKRFFKRFYADTVHVYEGAYGGDVLPGQEKYFEVKDGNTDDIRDLSNLAAAVAEPDDRKWLARLSGVADIDEMIRVWAVEQYIGHWDGYAPSINNYFLRCDKNGYFTMHPWGLDQAWTDFRDYHYGYGAVFARCMEIPECRARFDKVLLELVDIIDQLDIGGMAESLNSFISKYRAADSRRVCLEDHAHLEWTRWFIETRKLDSRMKVPCFVDSSTDQDKDGYLCDQDCNDTDPMINPGAEDVCFDWIDQDCSGLHDDGPGCPDCRAFWRGPHRYAFCTGKRTKTEAVAACRDIGLGPVIINSGEEQDWLLAQMPPIGMKSFWTGLENNNGSFQWHDGSTPEWTSWATGEPSDCSGCSCTVLTSSGGWTALDCGERHNVLCEAACDDRTVDSDGDGFGACEDDCDDGNSEVHPGAAEICGDRIDQDCDGMTDGLPECYMAFDVPVAPTISNGSRFILHVLPTDFETARILCGKYGPGAGLAWFDEPAQEASVAEIIRGWLGPARFIIGLNDLSEDGCWVWAEGNSPSYSNWGPNQPDRGERSNCVENGPDGFWNDIDCTMPRPFVCRVL